MRPLKSLAADGGATFFEALQALPPGVQLALLVMFAAAVASTTIAVVAVWYAARVVRETQAKLIEELHRGAASAASTAAALHGVEVAMEGIEKTLAANTVELARR